MNDLFIKNEITYKCRNSLISGIDDFDSTLIVQGSYRNVKLFNIKCKKIIIENENCQKLTIDNVKCQNIKISNSFYMKNININKSDICIDIEASMFKLSILNSVLRSSSILNCLCNMDIENSKFYGNFIIGSNVAINMANSNIEKSMIRGSKIKLIRNCCKFFANSLMSSNVEVLYKNLKCDQRDANDFYLITADSNIERKRGSNL